MVLIAAAAACCGCCYSASTAAREENKVSYCVESHWVRWPWSDTRTIDFICCQLCSTKILLMLRIRTCRKTSCYVTMTAISATCTASGHEFLSRTNIMSKAHYFIITSPVNLQFHRMINVILG